MGSFWSGIIPNTYKLISNTLMPHLVRKSVLAVVTATSPVRQQHQQPMSSDACEPQDVRQHEPNDVCEQRAADVQREADQVETGSDEYHVNEDVTMEVEVDDQLTDDMSEPSTAATVPSTCSVDSPSDGT